MDYVPNPVHRNGTPGKSQWTIAAHDEQRSFDRCVEEGWYRQNTGWGLHLHDGKPDWLGVTRDHRTPSFIAKFVGADGTWHGYPADVTHSKDVPSEVVIGAWLDQNLLSRAKGRKVIRGQPCHP